MSTFSKRHGYNSPDKEIVVREDAPQELRDFIIELAYGTGHDEVSLRDLIAKTLRRRTDFMSIFTQHYQHDIAEFINNCPWNKVYDIIENIYQSSSEQEAFAEEINSFFSANGIGWKLEDGHITYRGDKTFESELRKAEGVLEDAGLTTAANELRQAINDLSRRPEADITGAVQHALTGLECTAREASGGNKDTLGALIRKRPDLVPPQLDTAISKIYGFGSDQGRHLEEGRAPSFEEAELLVGLAAALSTYIGRKFKSSTTPSGSTDEAVLPPS